jgi:hypothetical protein
MLGMIALPKRAAVMGPNYESEELSSDEVRTLLDAGLVYPCQDDVCTNGGEVEVLHLYNFVDYEPGYRERIAAAERVLGRKFMWLADL